MDKPDPLFERIMEAVRRRAAAWEALQQAEEDVKAALADLVRKTRPKTEGSHSLTA